MTTLPAASPFRDEPIPASTDSKFRTIVLPSGRVATTLRHPTGRHQRDASRIAGKDPSMMTFALVAVTTRLDGREVAAEELLDLDLHDWMALLGEVLGGKES